MPVLKDGQIVPVRKKYFKSAYSIHKRIACVDRAQHFYRKKRQLLAYQIYNSTCPRGWKVMVQ